MFIRFVRDTRGVSAIEFALVLPVLFTLLLGSVELQRYMRIERKLSITATAMAQAMAQRSDEAADLAEMALVRHMIPDIVTPTTLTESMPIVVSIAGVAFSLKDPKCTASCAYQAHLMDAWSWNGDHTVPYDMFRACGELQYDADGPPSTFTLSIPFGPGTMTVVDLRLRYRPIIGSALLPETLLHRQGYAAPRFVKRLKLPEWDIRVLRCPGY